MEAVAHEMIRRTLQSGSQYVQNMNDSAVNHINSVIVEKWYEVRIVS